jgi:hypothetical protein
VGYSVAVPVGSKESLKLMREFLKKYYKVPSFKYAPFNPDMTFFPGLRGPVSDLSYDKSKMKIGFDYTGGLAHVWVTAMVKWMAVRVGKKIKIKGKLVPYYIYDGLEKIPITPNEEYLSILKYDLWFNNQQDYIREPFEAILKNNIIMLSCNWRKFRRIKNSRIGEKIFLPDNHKFYPAQIF